MKKNRTNRWELSSGVTRGLGEGGGASLAKGPTNRHSSIGRNFNDAKKFE